MKKALTLAVALMLPLAFISVPSTAQAAVCETELNLLIEGTKNLAGTNPSETAKIQNKLLKKLYEAQKDLAKGSPNDQYKAAKKVWEYDNELRKLWWKGDISCGSGASLEETAFVALTCIVRSYYPTSDYDPAANGVISCTPAP